ncbi:MAG: hypothetical protein R3352_01235 [Salinisphaeraceae bacterium]|nr:hypothetical protein [Salinisphaeraceae bacterium]
MTAGLLFQAEALEAGSWKLEAGSWKLEAGSWKLEAGSWKLEAGSWKLEAGKDCVKKCLSVKALQLWVGIYSNKLHPKALAYQVSK